MFRKSFFLSLLSFLLLFLVGCSDLPKWTEKNSGIISPDGQVFEEVEGMVVLPSTNFGGAIGQYNGYFIYSLSTLSSKEWVVYDFDGQNTVYKKKDIPMDITQFEVDGLISEWQHRSPFKSSMKPVNNPLYVQHLVKAIVKGETVPFQFSTNNIERIVYLTSKKYKGIGYKLYYHKGPQGSGYITTTWGFDIKTFQVNSFPSD